jgi:hypothetical protein
MIRTIPHVHVSERETEHRWPDGRLDDAKWEDCRFDAAVEWLRAMGRDIPPTHAEAEAIRAAAGLQPTGGSRHEDLVRGVMRRYGFAIPSQVEGAEALLAAMPPGTCAIVDGSLGNFVYGHRLRRWQPGFTGGHAVYVEHTADDVWLWCDPLAPVGYQPDRVSATEVRAFAWRGVVGKVAYTQGGQQDMYPIVTREAFAAPVAWRVKAGWTLRGYDPAQPGKVVKEVTFEKDSVAHATARVAVRWVGVDPAKAPIPRGAPFLEVSNGVFAGLLIVAGQVLLDPLPDPCADKAKAARAQALADAAAAIERLR